MKKSTPKLRKNAPIKWKILEILYNEDQLTLADIHRNLGQNERTKQTVHTHVNELCKKGLVHKLYNEEDKKKGGHGKYELTEEGTECCFSRFNLKNRIEEVIKKAQESGLRYVYLLTISGRFSKKINVDAFLDVFGYKEGESQEDSSKIDGEGFKKEDDYYMFDICSPGKPLVIIFTRDGKFIEVTCGLIDPNDWCTKGLIGMGKNAVLQYTLSYLIGYLLPIDMVAREMNSKLIVNFIWFTDLKDGTTIGKEKSLPWVEHLNELFPTKDFKEIKSSDANG